jgi:hypothetical protein
MQAPQPHENHRWLQQLVGEWEFAGEASMGPDDPPHQSKGTERVTTLGDLWVVGDGMGEMPGEGAVGQMRITLGYDPMKGKFVGNWIGSMMPGQWIYEGELDDARKVLTLNTVGPDMSAMEGCGADGLPTDGSAPKMANYRDIIELVSADERILRSEMQGADGQWVQFMETRYRRKG